MLPSPGVRWIVATRPPAVRPTSLFESRTLMPRCSNHLLVDLRRYTSGTHPNRKQPTQPHPTNACQPAMPTLLTPTNATNALGHALRRRWRRFESCRGHTLGTLYLLDYN